LHTYIERLFGVAALLAAAWELYHIWQLKRKIKALQNVEGIESVKQVEGTLARLAPPVCMICDHVILLGLCTTFVDAIERLEGLMVTAADWPKHKCNRYEAGARSLGQGFQA